MINVAYLKPESPFAALFPDLRVPIINIIVPSSVELEGSHETEAYMVDLDKCGNERISKIAHLLAERAGISPQLVFAEIKAKGLPLRLSQTTGCETDVPWFL